jgi:hypothetical protein
MQCRRAPHDVYGRCTSTPHTARNRTAQARTARAGTTGARNASMGSASAHTASVHTQRMHSRYTQREHGGHKYDNASMHSASTKHSPVHPRDVDDVDERTSNDLGERCTSAPHAQFSDPRVTRPPRHPIREGQLSNMTEPTICTRSVALTNLKRRRRGLTPGGKENFRCNKILHCGMPHTCQ